jgi:hypothetical protein
MYFGLVTCYAIIATGLAPLEGHCNVRVGSVLRQVGAHLVPEPQPLPLPSRRNIEVEVLAALAALPAVDRQEREPISGVGADACDREREARRDDRRRARAVHRDVEVRQRLEREPGREQLGADDTERRVAPRVLGL